ncbi:hypothetical protein JCM3765_004593 [Sporobolomyces pararoseus]
MAGDREEEFMVLYGDQDIGNEIKTIDYGALSSQANPNPSSSAANPLSPLQRKILSLPLRFRPVPSHELDHFLSNLGSSSFSIPVDFAYSKQNAKTPHLLQITSLSPSSKPLIEISALDPTCHVAQSWVSTHVPPPLTKAGQNFKNVKSAAARKAREERGTQIKVPVVGGGGLLDALITLNVNKESGLELKGELRVYREEVELNLQVFVDLAKFFPFGFCRAKQLLINRLFPQPQTSDAPEVATVDWFYNSLRRAPLTRDGLPLIAPAPAQTVVETLEERQVRLRREQKGKGRAIEDSPPSPQEAHRRTVQIAGEEDILLRPEGLSVQLFPFQSRSLRWMLSREGKTAKILRSEAVSQVAGGSKGKGREKMVEEEIGSEDEGMTAEDEEHRIELEDLSEDELKRLVRGPLWQSVNLESWNEKDEVEKLQIWLNRVTGLMSETDPIEMYSRTQKEDEHKMDSDQEEEVTGGQDGEEEEIESRVFEGHGLLADEVGTGKTVTTVSLVLLHSDPSRRNLPTYYNSQTDAQVQPTGLTLVVCPTAISGQWSQELSRLAPGLRVLRYDGIKLLKTTFTPSFIAKSFDLVLTTFDVLRREVAIARKPHVRSLRNQAARQPKYRRSLLVEVDFLRVIADETQMVGDSFSAISETLSLIPRQHSWAVTSTPLRDKIEDVRALLTYLRVEPIASTKASLSRLLEEPESFKRLFEEIGERTLKSQITNELYLPKQTRLVVPLDFTAIESFYYQGRYSEMLQSLGLNADGTPKEQFDRRTGKLLPWQPDKAEMNRWLSILRALAAHPQVGAAGRQALGHVLKTVDEVYATMRQQAISAIQTDQRMLLSLKVRRAQLGMWDKDVEDRFESALQVYAEVIEEVEPIIEEVTKEIHAAWKESRKSRSESSTSSGSNDVKGALQIGFANDEGQEKDSLSDREKAFARSLSGLRNRLRDLLFVKHSALFFSGHAFFNMKQEEKETEAYGAAERLRQTLLQSYEDHVERAQSNLLSSLEEREKEDTLDVTDLELSFNDQGHGIVALTVYEDIEITSDILNGYAELIFQYRQSIIDMILKTVSIAGDNATGEEYEERAVLQEKLEVYIEAYTVLLGEWCYGVVGTRSTLADQFKAEQSAIFFTEENLILPSPQKQAVNGKKRKVKAARLDSSDEEEEPEEEGRDENEGEGGKKKAKKDYGPKTRVQKKRNANIKNNSITDFRAPTLETGFTPADVLRYELLVERIEAKGEDREFAEITPLRHLIKKLKDAAELSNRDTEIALLDSEKKRISKALGHLEKVSDRLRNELAAFTTAINARLLYFKNLQSISDSVADPDMDDAKWRGLLIELEDLRLQEKDLLEILSEKEKRKRYLDNLNAAEEEGEHICPICAEPYNDGVLLACVHLVCRSCFKNWYSRSPTCPLCKAKIQDRSWQNVKYRRKGKKNDSPDDRDGREHALGQVKDGKESGNPDDAQVLQAFELSTPALAHLAQSEIDEMNSIENAAMLSTKADAVVSLTKLLRRRDPEAKIVIFSVWQEALELLMESFNRNGLQFVRLEGSSAKGKREGVVKRFQEDPDIAAFFLHTRSQSAGLTLTCARYMILLEPLLAPQLEIQATARIWRIGQTKETTVFNFLVKDTVDQRVAELRARLNTSLFVARDGDYDAEKESALGQQHSLASKEARSRTKNEASAEALDDEDEIARCLLSPEHYLALQRALLRLREDPLPPLPVVAPAGRVAPQVGNSGT